MGIWKSKRDKKIEKEKKIFAFLSERYEFKYCVNIGCMKYSEKSKNEFKFFDGSTECTISTELILDNLSVSMVELRKCIEKLSNPSYED